MSIELIIQIGTLLSILFGIAAFFWGINSYKRQMHAQVFIEYTKRFEEIMQSFPRNAWMARLNSESALPEPSDELSISVLKYLNLCSEEYYLCKDGYLSKRIWRIWEAELKRTLQTPLFKREWQRLSNEFQAYPEFRSYVNEAQQ
jgi:hypothetical protein